MKFRTFFIPLAVVSGFVFVVGLAILGGLLLRNPLSLIDQGGLQTPAALQFIPKQSTVVASVLARPDKLTDVWEYLTAPKLRQQTQRDIEQIQQTLVAGTGLDYEQDILPWLGEEITAAVVSADIDQDPSNGRKPGYFVALACKNHQVARATLELFWQNRAVAGDALTFEDFAGNRLIYSLAREGTISTPPGIAETTAGNLATTLVAHQFVLVANHPEVLRQALTAAQSNDTNLAADYRYRSALRALPKTRVGLVALNLSAFMQRAQSTELVGHPPVQLSNIGEAGDNLDWGLVSLGLTRKGILGDLAFTATPGQRLVPRMATLTDLPKFTSYLPEKLAVAAVGLDLNALWSAVRPLWQRVETAPISTFLGPDLTTLLDERLSDDFLRGASNHFALGLNPGQSTDWLMAFGHNRALAEALQHLKDTAQTEGIGVNTLALRGYTTTALTRLSVTPNLSQAPGRGVVTHLLGLHTEVNDMDLMASSPVLMDAALKASQGNELTAPAWSEELSLFQRPNEGYIHIYWPKLQSGLRQQIARFRLWETAAKPVLKHLQGVTLTSYGRTEEFQTGRVFLRLSNQ